MFGLLSQVPVPIPDSWFRASSDQAVVALFIALVLGLMTMVKVMYDNNKEVRKEFDKWQEGLLKEHQAQRESHSIAINQLVQDGQKNRDAWTNGARDIVSAIHDLRLRNHPETH